MREDLSSIAMLTAWRISIFYARTLITKQKPAEVSPINRLPACLSLGVQSTVTWFDTASPDAVLFCPAPGYTVLLQKGPTAQ
jgi:hypothetical protein